MKFILPLSVLLFLPLLGISQETKERINGISLWSDEKEQEAEDYNFIEYSGASWVSLQPYGVVETDSTGVTYDIENLWDCSSFKGLANSITILHSKGYKVCLKPHLILGYEKADVWVGDLDLGNSKNWNRFSVTYSNYILDLAFLADSLDVELFSLGTELGTFPRRERKVWRHLIDSVRTIYKGELTYSANFDEYKKFPFWEELDYIGIDAYFSVDTSRNPEIDAMMEKWKPIKKEIEKLSVKKKKQVLFMEYGYRSSDYCGYKPYAGHSDKVNLVAQANAYRALYYTFWYEKWFRGGFSWCWHFKHTEPEDYDNILYSPQNKPAQNILRKTYLELR